MIKYSPVIHVKNRDLNIMEKKKFYINLFECESPSKKTVLLTSCAYESLDDLEFCDPSSNEGFIKMIEIEVFVDGDKSCATGTES